MYKISISGKANSGKDTVAKMLAEHLKKQINKENIDCVQHIAFADPLKQIIKIMFPDVPDIHLYGPSKYRSEIIKDAFKGSEPLTIRQLLLDLGTEIGRGYNPDIWINAFRHTLNTAFLNNKDIVIVSDNRFRNEFDCLKNLKFYQIRVIRDKQLYINHSSETDQFNIKDEEFDCILENNGSLSDLSYKISEIANKIIKLK